MTLSLSLSLLLLLRLGRELLELLSSQSWENFTAMATGDTGVKTGEEGARVVFES
jgi:hypothetical protein